MEKVVFHKQNCTSFLALLWTSEEEMMEQSGVAPVSEANGSSVVTFYEKIYCPTTKEVLGITG